ncbi:MAG: F0F1 ATP synthase subunit epsilon [Candidatus Dadabacteria bacterium]|nr:MAG: F0F1 ATP synthase subunit epsilon [Candidatus Dadabacteria bacterium]
MQLRITSPVGGDAYDDVTYVSLWTSEGQIGVLPGHADLIATVVAGVVEIRSAVGTVRGVCGSGFLRIEHDVLYLAVEQWTADPAAMADPQRLAQIEAALAEAPGEATRSKLERERAFVQACRDAA